MAYIDTNRSPALTAALADSRSNSGLFGLFSALKSALDTAQRRQKLRTMSPHLLRDIGFSEGDIQVLRAQQNIRTPHHLIR